MAVTIRVYHYRDGTLAYRYDAEGGPSDVDTYDSHLVWSELIAALDELHGAPVAAHPDFAVVRQQELDALQEKASVLAWAANEVCSLLREAVMTGGEVDAIECGEAWTACVDAILTVHAAAASPDTEGRPE
jgi:hypothetical protein